MPSSRVKVLPTGFVEISFIAAEVQQALSMMKSRIRRLCALEETGPGHYADISRMARICFVLASAPPGLDVTVSRLSREDIDTLYALPCDARSEFLLRDLNDARSIALRTGPVDLDLSDLAAKSVYEVMES